VNLVALGSLCSKIGSGATPRGGSRVYREDGVALIRSQNVSSSGFIRNGLAFIDDENAQHLDGVSVAEGDVLLNITGESVGRVCQAPADILPARVNQHVSIVRPRPEALDPKYLRYLLVGPAMQLRLHALSTAGATRRALTKTMIERLEIYVPPLTVQRSAGGLLGALDDKTELNRRIAAMANELAHAIFRSCYRSDHPDLPREPLGEHVEVARGLSYTGAGLTDAGMPLHNLNSVYEGGGYKRDGIKHYTGDYQERHLIEPGDVVVATVEQGFDELLIAFPARIPRSFGELGLFSQDLFRLRPVEGSSLSPAFIYLSLLAGRLHEEVAGYANGTTVNRIPMEALQKPRFAVPSRELVKEIDALVTPLFDRAESAEDESKTLAKLRDTLLPKLISGEIRLREAEGAVADAV
jgi:type I restriction enzyme S subunit